MDTNPGTEGCVVKPLRYAWPGLLIMSIDSSRFLLSHGHPSWLKFTVPMGREDTEMATLKQLIVHISWVSAALTALYISSLIVVWSPVAPWSKGISSDGSQNQNIGLFISNSYSTVYSVHLSPRLDDLQLPVFVRTTVPIWRHTRWLISSCSMSRRKCICFCTAVSEQNKELKEKQLMQATATVWDIRS